MAAAGDLSKMVPGFDFLQSLMKNAGAGIPGMSQWIAPTLDPEELDKRIQDLRTVQFWLEQNVRMLTTTIQALEVQRMTLSTLQTMNLPMNDLREALEIKAAAPAPAAQPGRARTAAATGAAAASGTAAAAKSPAIDPMQWWGALTQQFTEIAARAVQDGSAQTAKGLAAAAAQQVQPAAAAASAALARTPARKPRAPGSKA
jgi:hypothetical protein